MKRILLVGAGNANLQVVHHGRDLRAADTELMLINDVAQVPYSGMVPGCIAGRYREAELTIDLPALCHAGGAAFRPGTVERLEPAQRRVVLSDGTSVPYDLLALNTGSRPAPPPDGLPTPQCLLLKPLASLVARCRTVEAALRRGPQRPHVAVVGGGAAAFEVTLALRQRLADRPDIRFTLYTASSRVPAGAPSWTARHAARALREQGIAMAPGARVVNADARALHLDDGRREAYDLCVWASHAEPTARPAATELARDARGFYRVDRYLRCVEHDDVFATGDCAALDHAPTLPKAGVFAVREGPVLLHNLSAALDGAPLRPYHPQRLFLFLLNVADGTAIMQYGPLAARGRWAMRWKDRIDRRWVQPFPRAADNAKPPEEHRDP